MTLIENKTFDEERALYGSRLVNIKNCSFDGPADGESAFKESCDICAESCYFNLRYPFWHNTELWINNCEMTELCRAALWYSDNIRIANTNLHGIKALRECNDVKLSKCDIVSPEFGWNTSKVTMRDCTAEGEYFMMRAEELKFKNVRLKGKYSFQYIKDAEFSDCYFDTKDAFWHAKNVTVRDSVIKGEYLAWYSDGLTLINCRIIGTQPFCYCEKLRLINCTMEETDLSFEYSDVDAQINGTVLSVKNPRAGRIISDGYGEIITEGAVKECNCEIRVREKQ